MRLVKQERQKIKRETVFYYHTQSCVIEKKVPFFTYDTLKQKRHKLYFFQNISSVSESMFVLGLRNEYRIQNHLMRKNKYLLTLQPTHV